MGKRRKHSRFQHTDSHVDQKHFAPGFDLSDIGDIIKKPFEEAADLATSIIDRVPGGKMAKGWVTDIVHGPLKDFANTTVGHVVLSAAVASFTFTPMGQALMPTVGTQIMGAVNVASIAVPNMLAGDDFMTAWTKEAVDRLVQVAQYFGGKAGEALGKVLGDQLKKCSEKLAAMGVEAARKLTFQALAKLTDSREDIAAMALDLYDKSKKRYRADLFDVKDGHYIGLEKQVVKQGTTATGAAQHAMRIGVAMGLVDKTGVSKGTGASGSATKGIAAGLVSKPITSLGRAKPAMTGAEPPKEVSATASKTPWIVGGGVAGAAVAVAAGVAAPLVAGAAAIGAGLAYVLKK